MKHRDKRVFNKTEAADYIGVSRRTIYTWQKQGYGPKFSKTPTGTEITTLANCDKFLAEIGQPPKQESPDCGVANISRSGQVDRS